MKCSVCGSDNLEGSAYCEDCGAKLPVGAAAAAARSMPSSMPPPMAPPMMGGSPPPYTPPAPVMPMGGRPGATVTCACGAVNSAGEQYCHDCGANLSGSTMGAPMSAPPPMYAPPAPMRPPSTAKLRATAYSRDFSVDRDVTQLGRRSPADGIEPEIDLTSMDPDSYASRRHARVLRQAGQYLLEDLGSSNGTFLNGTRLEKGVEHPLSDGDKVRVGKTEFVFSL